jgi:hypothetical protein
MPSDAEALEVQRNVLRRMREDKRTDVRGLTIVNHQRSLPPSERDPHCFQAEQVRNAADQEVGLMTAWDLWRLARGGAANGWPSEAVRPLLAEVAGRIEPIPGHYARVGEVVNFFEKAGAIAIQLDEGAGLRRGERIGLIGEVDYLEQEVESLQVDGADVKEAAPAAEVGVATSWTKQQVRAKMVVYRVGAGAAQPDLPFAEKDAGESAE